jgi:hypothetical protein
LTPVTSLLAGGNPGSQSKPRYSSPALVPCFPPCNPLF